MTNQTNGTTWKWSAQHSLYGRDIIVRYEHGDFTIGRIDADCWEASHFVAADGCVYHFGQYATPEKAMQACAARIGATVKQHTVGRPTLDEFEW